MESFVSVKDLPLEALSGHEPTKRVKNIDQMDDWIRSEAYYNLMGFINGISTAIQGIRISDDIYISETMQKLINIFDKLHELINDTPPNDEPQRFGNKAYRSWSRKMNHDIFMVLKDALPQESCHLFNELGYYLAESFGNAVRIDYGTGHELSFIFFMCSLFKAEILEEADNIAAALRLFNTYLIFVRRLQTTYRMEPAGSQGVWSLDDFQFVPFIWGSAQLSLHAPFDPSKFIDENIINEYKEDFMFIGCIDYICQVKTGHFAEHSNQLWSISAVPTWAKINFGLVKMFMKELLSKYPIIQHVLFGKLMSFKAVKPGTPLPNARLGFMPPKPPSVRVGSFNAMPPPGISSQKINSTTDEGSTARSSTSDASSEAEKGSDEQNKDESSEKERDKSIVH